MFTNLIKSINTLNNTLRDELRYHIDNTQLEIYKNRVTILKHEADALKEQLKDLQRDNEVLKDLITERKVNNE